MQLQLQLRLQRVTDPKPVRHSEWSPHDSHWYCMTSALLGKKECGSAAEYIELATGATRSLVEVQQCSRRRSSRLVSIDLLDASPNMI